MILFHPIQISELQDFGITNTISKIWKLGREVLTLESNPMEAILKLNNQSRIIIQGKIVNVIHAKEDGIRKGSFIIQSFKANHLVKVEFQDEFISTKELSMTYFIKYCAISCI